MHVYLYFVAVCVGLCIFFAGMALGMFIVEWQYKKDKKK